MVTAPLPPRVVPFVSSHELKPIDGSVSCGVRITSQYQRAITSIAAIGEEVPGIVVLSSEHKEVLFECDRLLLCYRRMNVETKIEPAAYINSENALEIRSGAPLIVWLFGVMQVPVER